MKTLLILFGLPIIVGVISHYCGLDGFVTAVLSALCYLICASWYVITESKKETK